MTKYKNPEYQSLYETMLTAAEDKTSELYWQGKPKRGAGHRAAFWDGFSGQFEFTGPKRSAHVVPGTMSAVCFMAGREFARRQSKAVLQGAPVKRRVGRPSMIGPHGGRRVQVYLDDDSLAIAAKLGEDGNVSDGIRKALKQAQVAEK